MAKILITGGSGMIGLEISKKLILEGHQVVHLSRNPKPEDNFPAFAWDIRKGVIDERAFDGVEIIIHLAGAPISLRWTEKNKQTIISSRVDSAELLLKYVKQLKLKLSLFISVSGVGFYGGDTGDKLLDEDSPAGNDFVAHVASEWERVADRFSPICSVTKIRTGVVLSDQGGAIPKMTLPIRYGVGSPLGSGKQYMSWIHIGDLVEIFYQAVREKMAGTYNAVSSEPVTNAYFTRVIARILKRPLFLPNVPSFVMKLFFGEMSILITGGNRVSNEKLIKSGFRFKFANLEMAIKDLLA